MPTSERWWQWPCTRMRRGPARNVRSGRIVGLGQERLEELLERQAGGRDGLGPGALARRGAGRDSRP